VPSLDASDRCEAGAPAGGARYPPRRRIFGRLNRRLHPYPPAKETAATEKGPPQRCGLVRDFRPCGPRSEGGAPTGGGLSATGVPSDMFIVHLFRRGAPAPRPVRPAKDDGSSDCGPGLGVVARAGRDAQGRHSTARRKGEVQHPGWREQPGVGRASALAPGAIPGGSLCGSTVPRGDIDWIALMTIGHSSYSLVMPTILPLARHKHPTRFVCSSLLRVVIHARNQPDPTAQHPQHYTEHQDQRRVGLNG
jgi:hypothetical protein